MVSEEQKQDSKEYKEVDRAIRRYVKEIDKTNRFNIKSEDLTYSGFFTNKMLIIHSIREGIPYRLFSKIKQVTPFTDEDWANYLGVSVKTLQRYKNEENHCFKSIHTEKIIELAEVTNFGTAVFDTIDQFYNWLHTPSFALGKLKPADLLSDSYGKELVMGELNRIDQGIFA